MEEIEKTYIKEYENGETLKIRYVGMPYEIYKDEKVQNLFDVFLSEKVTHSDMQRNVVYIRTILNTCGEKLLVVEYSDGCNEEIVKYDNGNLISYECRMWDNESSNCMKVKYQLGEALKISFSDLDDGNILEYQNAKVIKDKSDKIIDHIVSLNNAKSVYLNDDSKALIEIYKIFYNENPDFSKEDINIKIQTMMSILAQFDISLWDCSFSIIEKMPESLTLLEMVNRLFPLGEVVVVEDPVELKNNAKETIKIVGDTIREAISDDEDMNEALITISKTIYAGRYDMTSYYDVRKLTEYPNINLTFKEADSSAQLVKKINRKLFDNEYRKM